MFTENDPIKYTISLIDDLSNLCIDYKAGKLSLLDASAKYEELKDFYGLLVARGNISPDDYKDCFVKCASFGDLFAYTKEALGEA